MPHLRQRQLSSEIQELNKNIITAANEKLSMPTIEELMRIGVDAKGESIFLNREDSSKAAFRKLNRKLTFEELMRIGTDSSGESIFATREDSALAAHKDIQELTQKVIDAANGKPLKTSITAEREKEEIAGSFIKQFILRMMNGDDMGIKENPEPKKEETT